MDATVDVEGLFATVREAAGLLGVEGPGEGLWPVLTGFRDVLASPFVFDTVARAGRVGDLAFDFAVPASAGDPYGIAVAHGLVEETDHRVGGLFKDLQARLPVQVFGVDCSVSAGFTKAYAFFPLGGLRGLAELAEVPSVPRGLAEQADALVRWGLDGKVSAIAVDYRHRTWNLYFNGLPASFVERDRVGAMLRDLGLPEPSGRLLDFIETSSALYPTFGWDSSKIERISFSTRTTDPAALPVRVEPRLEAFARSVPYTYEGDRVLVYAGTLAPGEEYYKLAVYHQLAAETYDRVRAQR